MLHDGLYEQIINKGLEIELGSTDKLSTTAPIDSAEASKNTSQRSSKKVLIISLIMVVT